MNIVKGFCLAVTAALFWGVSGTFAQFLFQQRGINIEWMITIRLLVSGFSLLIFAKFGEKSDLFEIWKDKKDAVQLVIFSITGMLAVQYTYFAAIKYSNAATATVLQYAGPVIIAVYLAFKNKRFPLILEVIAIILAVLGTVLLVTHGDISSLSISGIALFFGLASAVALAVYTLQPVKLMSKYKSSLVIGWGMLCGGIVFSFVKAPWDIQGNWNLQAFGYTVFIVIFGTLIAFYSYLSAVQIIGGQKTSLLASMEPLSATVLAVLWLNVSYSAVDWIGSIFIISTVFLLSIKPRKIKPIEERLK
ncbi:transporter [Chryseobacterium contaminans]|uniref:Transporter n=1 Tax=Chryseobacterium contaminans TaxID=1423959 RepID=A0A1M7CEU3_9FLAO|nr:EamA family transporter [Chryseobacterium contaminans]OCA79676.1 transporter [Chryseobacterium contaminans]SHL65752.1 Threonine/homoserine efflux transporter RhtA [Chryseobacterium contaminans]